MIEQISLKEIASYDQLGVTINNLKKINIFYGNNGSGKTTISELIRNVELYPTCLIEWKNKKLTTYVYNRNFVKENFFLGNPIKGIFTLGKESVNAQSNINDLKEKILSHENAIVNLREKNNDITKEKGLLIKNFTQECWRIKTTIDTDFKDLIKGFRNSQDKFMQKCIEEANDNKSELKPLEDLKTRKNNLFNRHGEVVVKPKRIHFDSKVEDHSIYTTKIIGRNDIDIADLIIKLNISDWVNNGVNITKHTEGVCPFCQRPLPVLFEEKINSYFDQTYETQINLLKEITENYFEHVQNTINQINTIIDDEKNSFVNKEKLYNLLILIQSKYDENKLLLQQKKNEPSKSIELVQLKVIIEQINNEISISNKEIDEFNKLIENSRQEKERLTKDIWRYIIDINSINFMEYNQKIKKIEKTLQGLNTGITQKDHYLKKYEQELIQFQQQISSVEHSVNEINTILDAFGFINFKLATAPGEGNYRIIRDTGENADDTLSEGEKTFITFLYFIQLLKGSNTITEIATEKIVVIDDPISSLDSNILFMVSNLVRQLMFDINEKNTDIKQLFLLTHNIYFHKEVSFNKGKKTFGEGTFWIIRKNNNVSSVQRYDHNPIKTSYELLWKELQNPVNQSHISIQNIMRRIIENYFKFFGNMNLDELEEKFEFDERIVCRSLLSWLHDGSHSVSEDLYVESNIDVIDRYMIVFKKIFYNSGQNAHYEMMMRDYEYEPTSNVVTIATNQGISEVLSGIREAASSSDVIS